MTDIPALDAEIVKAAEAWFAKAPAEYRDRFHAEACAIFDAVAAKRAADKPKPLSAEEAYTMFAPTCGLWTMEEMAEDIRNGRLRSMQAVLAAAAERWLKVVLRAIDDLPRHHHPRDSEDTATVNKISVEIAIRSALKPGGQ